MTLTPAEIIAAIEALLSGKGEWGTVLVGVEDLRRLVELAKELPRLREIVGKQTRTIAIYWPKDGGYGGHTTIHNDEHLAKEIEQIKKWGFGRKCNPIHVIRHTASVVEQVIDDQPEPPPQASRSEQKRQSAGNTNTKEQ